GPVEEKNGKLFIKGSVHTPDDVNAIWNALKTIPEWRQEIVADIHADQPAAAQPGSSSASGGGQAAQAERTYTVRPGDSLSKIAQQELGDGRQYMKIFDANRDQLKDPNLIHPGQVLKIPAREA